MREILWRPRAVADLDGILTYLALELKAPQAAESCAEAVLGRIESVAEMPTLGRKFHDESLDRPYYRTLVKNYWIYYTATNETLTVWRIFHTSQDTDAYGFDLLDSM